MSSCSSALVSTRIGASSGMRAATSARHRAIASAFFDVERWRTTPRPGSAIISGGRRPSGGARSRPPSTEASTKTRPEEHHVVGIERAEPRDREAFRVERDGVRGEVLRQAIVRALDDRGKRFRCRLVALRAPARTTLRRRDQCDRRLPQPSRRRRRGRDWRGRERSCPSSAVPQSHGRAASPACDTGRTQARHPRAASSVRATRDSPSRRTASAIVFTQWIWTTTGDGMIACTLVSIEGRRPLAFSCASTKSTAAAARGSPSAIALRRGSRRTGVMMSCASASASQVPDALIHMTPSRLIDVLPPAPCVRNGSAPSAADSSRSA